MSGYRNGGASRRSLLTAFGAAAIGLSFTACGQKPKLAPGQEESKLNFYNWDTYIGETTLADFKKATGVDVNMSLFATNDELFAKLRAGNPGFDVIVPGSEFVERMFEGTLIKDKPDEAIVSCPELDPYDVYVPHAVLGKKQSSVWVAIRPEKMNLHKDSDAPPTVRECPELHNVAKGQIKDVSYLGDISIFHGDFGRGAGRRQDRGSAG